MTMGYAVFHMQKTRGTDSGTSAHIERKVKPSNADEVLSRLKLKQYQNTRSKERRVGKERRPRG